MMERRLENTIYNELWARATKKQGDTVCTNPNTRLTGFHYMIMRDMKLGFVIARTNRAEKLLHQRESHA